MARIRSVHPGFFTDESLVSVSMAARLLFIGLGVEADDKGIFEWKPLTLKMRIFPADGVDLSSLLSELEAANAICSYEIGCRKYGAIRNFRKFQKPKTPNDIHPITDDFRIYVGLEAACSEQFPQKVETLPQKEEKSSLMEEGGGRKEEEKNTKIQETSQDGLVASPTAPRKAKRAKARSQIDENAQPDEKDRVSAAEHGLSAELFRSEWRKFRDHHLAKGSEFADWNAAWRKWCGNVGQFQSPNARAGPRQEPVFKNGFAAVHEAVSNGKFSEENDDECPFRPTTAGAGKAGPNAFDDGTNSSGTLLDLVATRADSG